jgi:putative FmdB family regulatory protein
MPIYEYLCQDCDTRFEVVRAIKDADAPMMCNVCESRNTKRAISVFFASSGGKALAGSGGGCGNCSGGSCSGCGHSH